MPRPSARPAARLQVLVVDDDAEVRRTLALALRDEGYEVLTAGDGQVALGVIAGRRPDLILLDVMMPRMNGWQFADAYRAQPGRHAPIIVMSAVRGAVDRAAREIGAVDVLEKPIDLDVLAETLALHLRPAA